MTQTVRKRKRKFRQVKSLKSKIVATLPAKHNTFNTSVTMTANSAYSIFPTRNITQGTTIQDRLGDEIFLEALKLKGAFESDAASNAYQFRIIVGYTGEEYSVGANAWVSTGLTASEVYQPNTFSVLTNGITNKKAVTVLYDQTMDVNSQIDGDRVIHGYDILVPLKQKFAYQSSGSTFGKYKNLFVWIVGYGVGLSGLSTVGYNNTSVDLIFKD